MRTATCIAIVATLVLLAGCRDNQPQSTIPAAPAAQAVPAMAAPLQFSVAELPDYPAATRTKYKEEAKTGYSRAVEAEFVVNDAFDNVRSFYAGSIPANGWQIAATSQKPGEIEWSLYKGTSEAKVEVELEGTAVAIKLERKDR